MIMFLLKHFKIKIYRIRNINKFIEKKKIRRREYPARRCGCRHYRRIRRCRKFRKLSNNERIRRIRRTNIR